MRWVWACGRSPRRRRVALLAAVGSIVTPASRATASPSAHLVYVRDATAAECPSEEDLRRSVKARVGYDPFFPWAKTTVIVEMVRDGRSLVARVRLVDADGRSRGVRELRSVARGCGGLIDASALAISIALDLSGDVAGADAPAPPPADSAPAVAATDSFLPPPAAAPLGAPRERAVARPAEWQLRTAMGLDATAAIDAAPSTVGGADVWAGIGVGQGSVAIELQGDGPASRSPPGGGRVDVWQIGLSVAPCAHWGIGFVCALGALDWLQASGADVTNPKAGSALYPAAGGRVGVEVPVDSRLAVRLRGDLLANLLRPTVTLDGSAAWEVSPASAFLGAGLTYQFP